MCAEPEHKDPAATMRPVRPVVKESWVPHVCGGIILLLVLALAVLTPDILGYWNASTRLKALSEASQASIKATDALIRSAEASTEATKVIARVSPTTQNVQATTQATQASAQSAQLAAGAAQAVAQAIQTVGGVPSSASIYETYAKLITMMLGFVAAVGVWIGYFVRKNVRDLIDDVRADVDRELAAAEREHKRAVDQVEKESAKVKTVSGELSKLKAQYEQSLAEAAAKLKALEEVASAERSAAGTGMQTSQEAVEEVEQSLPEEVQ